MAYTELVKNFNRIRDYMREFYIYGFKSRDEYTKKSARSYDDERRRLASWLGENMQFRQTTEGKNVFLSIDSRMLHHNPLYKAWKTKSFTDGDITLHFILMDIFATGESMTVSDISERIDDYLAAFANPRLFDESTIRKKLKEYVGEGLLEKKKQGKTMYYRKAPNLAFYDADVLDFFSEIAPCGVIGSFLLDKRKRQKENFAFNHHYITGAIDSEIVSQLFQAMHENRMVCMRGVNRKENVSEIKVLPLQIFISVQNGRQYVMAYEQKHKRISSFRIDNIVKITPGNTSDRLEELRGQLEKMKSHMWGVSTQSRSGMRMETVTFTVRYGYGEQHIHQRLEREKRCGYAEIIKAAIDHPLQKEEMRKIIQHYAFEESVLNIEPALTEERWQLLQPDGTTIIHKQPSMPLTTIQKQWLKAISLDERIRLFLDEPLDFGDVAPLFTPDDFYVFDKYADGDNYSDENYIRNFRMILDAIKNGQPLKVEMYNHKGKPIEMILLPRYLEYSEKDDKFRVVGYGQKLGGTVNLGRIIRCEHYANEEGIRFTRRIPKRKRSVIFELTDERKALERVLLHFAHYEKQAEKLEGNRYKITVNYDKDDETEIVIRILSFGPMIKAIAPGHFVDLIKERLLRQKSCGL